MEQGVGLFAMITIAFAGQAAIVAAMMGARRFPWMDLLPLAVLAPLAAHLALEGPRWQMAPVYAVALAACALAVRRRLRGAAGAGSPGEGDPAAARRADRRARLLGWGGIVLLVAGLTLEVAAR